MIFDEINKFNEDYKNKLAQFHPAQGGWMIALAAYEAAKDCQSKAGSDRDYEKYGRLMLQNFDELKIATVRLLEFGRAAAKQIAEKCGQPYTDEIDRLYSDDIINYCQTKILPNSWQSKVIDTIVKLDARALKINC